MELFVNTLRDLLNQGKAFRGKQSEAVQRLLKNHDFLISNIPLHVPGDVPHRWMVRDLNFILQNIAALAFLIQGFHREKILAELSNENPETIQGVMSRWGWMSFQHSSKHISDFQFPYLCEVGEPDDRNIRDREFFKLLNFLPQYTSETGKSYLFHEHLNSGPPDFKVEAAGTVLGIEVTEVPINPDYSVEQVFRAKFRKAINERLKNKLFTVRITGRPSWQFLFENIESIIAGLEKYFLETDLSNVDPHSPGYFKLPLAELFARISKSNDYFCLLSDIEENLSYKDEDQFLEAVQHSLDSKMMKRHFYYLPSILVMYLNGAFHIDKGYLSKFKEYFTFREDCVYSEVWLLDEKWILKIK
jgi:hypothetical protein